MTEELTLCGLICTAEIRLSKLPNKQGAHTQKKELFSRQHYTIFLNITFFIGISYQNKLHISLHFHTLS